MAFDVSALAAYTEQNEALLVTDSVLGAKTASLIKSCLLYTSDAADE